MDGSVNICTDSMADTLGKPNGVATLDADGLLSESQRPKTPDATQSTAGLMSAADKAKLDNIAEGANKYTLPAASASTRGGVKTGSNITNKDGTISITKDNVTKALGYTPPESDTWRGVQDNLTSTATDQSLSAKQGKVLKDLVDGKSPSGHTHNYAGSSTPGGTANSVNGFKFVAQTTDPGAGSTLANGTVLLVYE